MQKQHTAMCNNLIDKLEKENYLSFEEYLYLIKNRDKCANYLYDKANKMRKKVYGDKIYIRGLIEFSNYCKNDCLYCGIRRSNSNAERYRLTKEEILECADEGYKLRLSYICYAKWRRYVFHR